MRLLLTLGLKSMEVAGVEMKPLQHVLRVPFERDGSCTSPHILIFYRWHTPSLIPVRKCCCYGRNYDTTRHRYLVINCVWLAGPRLRHCEWLFCFFFILLVSKHMITCLLDPCWLLVEQILVFLPGYTQPPWFKRLDIKSYKRKSRKK